MSHFANNQEIRVPIYILFAVVMKTEHHKLLNQQDLNQLKYDKAKLEEKLREKKTYFSYLQRMIRPKREEESKSHDQE